MLTTLCIIGTLVGIWGVSVLFGKVWNLGAKQEQTKLLKQLEEWKIRYEQEKMLRLENDAQVLARYINGSYSHATMPPQQSTSWWNKKQNMQPTQSHS